MAIDNQTIQKTRRLHTTDLLDQLSFISAALKEVREQQHAVLAQQQSLFEQQQSLFEQRQVLSLEETTLLQEESAILAQISSLRERRW